MTPTFSPKDPLCFLERINRYTRRVRPLSRGPVKTGYSKRKLFTTIILLTLPLSYLSLSPPTGTLVTHPPLSTLFPIIPVVGVPYRDSDSW